MKKAVKIFLLCTPLFILLFALYVYWDNQRFILTEQEIMVDRNLTEEVRILQITDLHEEVFGSDQSDLTETINDLEYDIILFTGDMMNSIENGDTEPFFDLVKGIENKDHAYFVTGNTDPYPYEVTESSIQKAAYIQEMESLGVAYLESIEEIEVKGQNLVLTDHELSVLNPGEAYTYVEGKPKIPYESAPVYKEYKQNQLNEVSRLLSETDEMVISITHYPVADPQFEHIKEESDRYVFRDYDLIIAGHYHGGQFRLPFIGALFVPEAWYQNAVLPPQDRVKGLWESNGIQQYVSTGLGSSNAVSFLNFRLFNPPEINLITLKSAESPAD
ncbi:metallophosphoesterase [Jeotgalibacillus malaysiensis]|uniref:metallophosphoesterase n=1 Tax=Jeotgalibacillus malaysiensis TaxID=1508404 RepID=UPI00384BEDD2